MVGDSVNLNPRTWSWDRAANESRSTTSCNSGSAILSLGEVVAGALAVASGATPRDLDISRLASSVGLLAVWSVGRLTAVASLGPVASVGLCQPILWMRLTKCCTGGDDQILAAG